MIIQHPVVRWLIKGAGIPAVILAGYLFFFLGTLRESPWFSAFTTVEQISYYQAARNFNERGFLASGFLQDFSTSSRPQDHPYVYNHMPPGPDIITALLTRVLGERYRLLRVFFAGVFVVGIGCFCRFAQLLLRDRGLEGGALAILLIPPMAVMRNMDHAMYCAFPFMAFFPLVALQRYYRTDHRRWLVAALAVVFLASMFLAYQFLLMMLVSWLGLRLLRLLRLERRHVAMFFLVVVAGLGLHVLQNVVVLGPSVARDDIVLTLSNRASGKPTGEELKEFYHSHNIVHHGRHKVDGGRFAHAIAGNLHAPGSLVLLLAAGVLGTRLLLEVRRRNRAAREEEPFWSGEAGELVSLLFRLLCWIVPTVLVPLAVFPAYSSDYGLQGFGAMYTSIGAVALLAALFREARRPEGTGNVLASGRATVFSRVVLLVAFSFAVAWVGFKQWVNVRKCVATARSNPHASLGNIAGIVGGKFVMTNVYPVTVGFFTREAVVGVARAHAVPEDGDPRPEAGEARYIRNHGSSHDRRPTHFVLVRGLDPGFGDGGEPLSLAALEARMAGGHRVVYSDALVTVFELSYGRESPGGGRR